MCAYLDEALRVETSGTAAVDLAYEYAGQLVEAVPRDTVSVWRRHWERLGYRGLWPAIVKAGAVHDDGRKPSSEQNNVLD